MILRDNPWFHKSTYKTAGDRAKKLEGHKKATLTAKELLRVRSMLGGHDKFTLTAKEAAQLREMNKGPSKVYWEPMSINKRRNEWNAERHRLQEKFGGLNKRKPVGRPIRRGLARGTRSGAQVKSFLEAAFKTMK